MALYVEEIVAEGQPSYTVGEPRQIEGPEQIVHSGRKRGFENTVAAGLFGACPAEFAGRVAFGAGLVGSFLGTGSKQGRRVDYILEVSAEKLVGEDIAWDFGLALHYYTEWIPIEGIGLVNFAGRVCWRADGFLVWKNFLE